MMSKPHASPMAFAMQSAITSQHAPPSGTEEQQTDLLEPEPMLRGSSDQQSPVQGNADTAYTEYWDRFSDGATDLSGAQLLPCRQVSHCKPVKLL